MLHIGTGTQKMNLLNCMIPPLHSCKGKDDSSLCCIYKLQFLMVKYCRKSVFIWSFVTNNVNPSTISWNLYKFAQNLKKYIAYG